MERLKIQDLQEGKLYRFYGEEGDNTPNRYYRINNNGDLIVAFEDEVDKEYPSGLHYNRVIHGFFDEIEREIDWSKVPRGTKVQIRDNEKGSWRNAYFLKFIKENEEYPFRASFMKDDEFTNLKMDDNEWGYKYCRIYSSTEILPEWFKEEIENKEDEETINNEIAQEEIDSESLDTLRDKVNDLVGQIKSNNNYDFNIISQNLTREEMIKVIKTTFEGFYKCPDDYDGLNYKKDICLQDDDCEKCWLYAIKEVKFKDEE